MDELSYKEAIEQMRDENDFESLGDELFLEHEDEEARLEWAFYRPSGSHPRQVQDPSPIVSIMAFNHSRLGAYERFCLLNPSVISDERLRVKIRNRSRMLFRAMIDDDFKELVLVLQKYPVFFDLAYDQMINGRIWNESYADPEAASTFLSIASQRTDRELLKGVKRRLQPVNAMGVDQAKAYLQLLCEQAQNLHKEIKEHFAKEFEGWLEKISLHPLQKIIWQKQINLLKERA